MILLSGFLDVLFRAIVFIGLSLSVGGIIFYFLVFQPSKTESSSINDLSKRIASLVTVGAFTVVVFQLLVLVVAASAVVDNDGNLFISRFLSTDFARAGLIHSGLALGLGIVGLRLRRRSQSMFLWGLAALFAVLMMSSGAWLTHGASRLHHARSLMLVTVIHQLAAVTWIGGLMHLVSQWQILGRSPIKKNVWPRLLGHFSPLALTSVTVLVFCGIYLSALYIRSPFGLIGTAYGNMLITKIVLMAGLLLLGGSNNLTIRQWKLTGNKAQLFRRTPVFSRAEAVIGVIVLMVAAALTSLPPAVDIRALWATPLEVLSVFAPKIPQLTMPPYAKMLSGAGSSLDIYWTSTRLEQIQSNFNHNISGILVILLGLGALLHSVTKWRWTRHWPLLFLPLAAFLVVIGEPTGWPLGKEGFFATLASPEVLSHRLATLIVIILGFLEWRVQAGRLSETNWRYMLPVLSIVGGALLLTHSHSAFVTKRAFLIEVSHNAIGILAVFAGAARWIELQLDGRENRIASLIWPICFILVGVVLLFYREI